MRVVRYLAPALHGTKRWVFWRFMASVNEPPSACIRYMKCFFASQLYPEAQALAVQSSEGLLLDLIHTAANSDALSRPQFIRHHLQRMRFRRCMYYT